MNKDTTLKNVISKALFYIALLGMANVVGAFSLWQSSNCWAQQMVSVSPGANLQALVQQYPTSTTFSLAPGTYRLQSVIPQDNDAFVGQPGVILSGAALLTNFTYSGTYWVAQAQVAQSGPYSGQCNPAYPACTLPEDLFFDNTPKTRVTSLAAVAPGAWYLDYSTGKVYMGDDPSGHTVEISLLPYAFSGGATSVSITNMTIEKYACPYGTGAVNGAGGSNYWSVGGNEVRYNHSTGIRTGNSMYVYNNYAHNNGELGIGGGGVNVLVQSNEIAFNNFDGYSYYWEAGGAKFGGIQDLTFRYNYSHDNFGPGFWVDNNSQYVVCDSNQFTNNTEAGAFTELSDSITISNNYIWNDGFNPDGTGVWWGAGILMTDSTNVSVYFNTVSNCMDGIAGILSNRGNGPNGQPYTLQNVNVNSNWITQNSGMAAGIAVEGTGFDNSVYTSWNNQFQYNTFNLDNPSAPYFYWMGQPLTFSAWGVVLAGN
jgi:hypothetical protein